MPTRQQARRRWYSVGIDVECRPLTERQLDALIVAAEAARSDAWRGPALSGGGAPKGAGIQVSVMAVDAVDAAAQALTGFLGVAAKAGIKVRDVLRVDVMTEEFLDRWLEPPGHDGYLGVAEVARLLGVSKQRVSELRRQELFPEPLADLESGPVWAASSLRGFMATWKRRGGRPRTLPSDAIPEELERIPRHARGSAQNELRMVYQAMRRHQLSEAPERSARAVLSEALHFVRQDHSDYLFEIDWPWFRGREAIR